VLLGVRLAHFAQHTCHPLLLSGALPLLTNFLLFVCARSQFIPRLATRNQFIPGLAKGDLPSKIQNQIHRQQPILILLSAALVSA
jgi:hypothetical protein